MLKLRGEMSKKVDFTLAITLHSEGKIAKDTFASIIEALEGSNFLYEIFVHVDSGTDETIRVAEEFVKNTPQAVLYKNNFADLSLSRNFCINQANGEFIAFLDGDDIFSKRWLKGAFNQLKKDSNQVLHPEYVITFGNKQHHQIWRLRNSFSDKKDCMILLGFNRWSAACATSVKIAKKYSYRKFDPGLGYEDWHFNATTRNEGIKHRVVKNTAIFYRQSDSSLMKRSLGEKLELAKTEEFKLEKLKQIKPLLPANYYYFKNRVRSKFYYGYLNHDLIRKIHCLIGIDRLSIPIIREWLEKSKKYPALKVSFKQILISDFYNSENDLLGNYYLELVKNIPANCTNLAFDISEDGYTLVDFEKITHRLTKTEREILMARLMIQNDINSVVCRRNSFCVKWLNEHKTLIDDKKIKVECL